jgi:hypothetical protein
VKVRNWDRDVWELMFIEADVESRRKEIETGYIDTSFGGRRIHFIIGLSLRCFEL